MIRSTLASEAKAKQFASECFAVFDKDGNGKLGFDELRECMIHINANLGIGEFRDRDVEYYMRRFDTDADNHLSCLEFVDVYRYLLLMKLNAEDPLPIHREMFLGKRLGRPSEHYKVVEELGHGTYGVVHKVLCRTTTSIRVMKTIDKRKAARGGLSTKLVMEEIERLKTLDHPAVLRLFEYFVDADAVYLVTDLLPGGDLAQAVQNAHMKQTPFDSEWIRTVFRQTCEGVSYLHAKGVMHKDLKLDNIVLSAKEPPEAVIIDVGLAELFPVRNADEFHSDELAGTLATMAPEVLARSFTYKCDVWSLGCCLYALVCTRPLWYFHSDDTHEIYAYPFRAPMRNSPEDIEAYVDRQCQGPDMTRTKCSNDARHLVRSMLLVSDRLRPNMSQVLDHPWMQKEDTHQTLAPEQLDCLLHFNHANALEEIVLLDVASQLPLGELSELRGLFAQMDKDGDGRLDADELVEGMLRAGLDERVARQVAQRFAHQGYVEFSRFIAALVPSCQDLLKQHLRDAFNRLDVDGDGFVTAVELRGLLENGKFKQLRALRAVRSMFEALGGGTRISFEQLSRYFSELCV